MISTHMMIVATLLVIVGLVGTIIFGLRRHSGLALFLKMTASTGFLLLALGGGALTHLYGQILLVVLIFCWIGDLLLFFRDERAFLVGLGAFLMAHLCLLVAFWSRGIAGVWCLAAVVVLAPVGIGIYRWISPHVPKKMLVPVLAYMFVISLMVVLAAGARGAGASMLVLAGAAMFYASDIFVARDRFLGKEQTNTIVGLPLYYAAVTLLAFSVTFA